MWFKSQYFYPMLYILVQNMSLQLPLLVKTRRYYSLVKLKNVALFSLWLTNILFRSNFYSYYIFRTNPIFYYIFNFNSSFYLSFLEKNLWFFFKKLIFKNQGLLTNTLTNSYFYWLSKNFYYILFSIKRGDSKLLFNFYHSNKEYLTPIRTLNISFNKNFLNKKIISFFFLLYLDNLSFKNIFNMSYSFFLLPLNFTWFYFFNIFFFKIHNY